MLSHRFALARQVLVQDGDEELLGTGRVDLNLRSAERFQARDSSDVVEIPGLTGLQQRRFEPDGTRTERWNAPSSNELGEAILHAFTAAPRR